MLPKVFNLSAAGCAAYQFGDCDFLRHPKSCTCCQSALSWLSPAESMYAVLPGKLGEYGANCRPSECSMIGLLRSLRYTLQLWASWILIWCDASFRMQFLAPAVHWRHYCAVLSSRKLTQVVIQTHIQSKSR